MTLTMLQGIPASGKSTYALERWKQGDIIVNKDDIRAELITQGWTWSHKNEKDVIKIRDERISNALKQGRDVISDDTNFAVKHQARLKQLADQYGAEFEIKFFDVSVEEAIRRDALRERSVGEAVIRQMAEQYLSAPIVKYVEDPKLPWCVMCDLDGTAALIGARSPYDGGSCHLDLPNEPVRWVLTALKGAGIKDLTIIYMSGRDDAHKEKTSEWLFKYGFPKGQLHMRTTGDRRKDSIVKGKLFDAFVRGIYNVALVLDDRDSVVAYWRSLGLPTWQVNPGNF